MGMNSRGGDSNIKMPGCVCWVSENARMGWERGVEGGGGLLRPENGMNYESTLRRFGLS